jgi:hypothetical protein
MIALAFVKEDKEGKIIDPNPVPDAFEAECALCKNQKRYAKYEVTKWDGPLPGPRFAEHPAFS